jgi:hypothetical protein
MKRKSTKKYCCERSAQCAEEGSIFHCGKEDETEWAVKDFYHLYYCPFCGDFIMGVSRLLKGSHFQEVNREPVFQ